MSLFTLKNDIENLIALKQQLETERDNLKKQIISETDELASLKLKKEELENLLKHREEFFVSTELKYIDNLEGLEFENYCADILKKIGFLNVEVTVSSGDYGADVIGFKDNIKYAFQCKRVAEQLSAKPIGEVLRAKGNYKCSKAVIITNNFFSKNAIEEAKNNEVELWDRNKLKEILFVVYHFDFAHIDEIPNVKKKDNKKNDEDIDPLLEDAIECAIETGLASTSFIQRRFKVNYERAGRIIDQMEDRGIISGYEGSQPRKVLMTKERWKELNK